MIELLYMNKKTSDICLDAASSRKCHTPTYKAGFRYPFFCVFPCWFVGFFNGLLCAPSPRKLLVMRNSFVPLAPMAQDGRRGGSGHSPVVVTGRGGASSQFMQYFFGSSYAIWLCRYNWVQLLSCHTSFF